MKIMSSIVEALKKDPKRRLSVSDIRREGCMPWATHHRTIIGFIRGDMLGPNLLKTKVEGDGNHTRYTIEARNLIIYLNAYSPVLMRLVRKQKKTP